MTRLGPAIASALLPGLGQALRGRWANAALLLAAAIWLHGFLGAHGPPGARLEAFAFGAPAIPRGLAMPVLVVFTVLAASVHALAAWDAARDAGRKEVGEV